MNRNRATTWSGTGTVSQPVADFSRIATSVAFGALVGMYPTPARLDITVLVLALARSTGGGVLAFAAIAFGVWSRHGIDGHELAGLVPCLVAGIAGMAAMRWRFDPSQPPRRSAVRLVALVATAAALGGIDRLVDGGEWLSASEWTAGSLSILTGLLLAAAVVFRPRRVVVAAPLFAPVLVGLVAVGAVAYTVDFWEGRDDSLLHITVDASLDGFVQYVGDQVNTLSAKTASIGPGGLTPDNFASSLQVTLYGREALNGAVLLQRTESGTFAATALTSKLGGEYETLLGEFAAATDPGFLDVISTVGAVVPIGQVALPTAEGELQPNMVLAGAVQADAGNTIVGVAMSLPSVLDRSAVTALTTGGGAFLDLYRQTATETTLTWSTEAAVTERLAAAPESERVPALPADERGSVAVSDPASLNDTYVLVARRGADFGTSNEFRRLVFGVEGFLGVGLAVLFVVVADQSFTRERERMRREALMAAALQGSPGWTAVVDLTNRVVMSNNHEHGVPAGALVSESAIWSSDPLTSAEVAQMLTDARRGVPGSFTHHWTDPDDETAAMRIVQVDIRPLPDPRLVYLQCVDITEQRDRAMRTAQSERMEAIGVLAGSLAHDFNNLLFITLGYLQMLERQPVVAGDAQARTFVSRAVEAVERGATVAKSLLSFARSQPLESSVIAVNTFLSELRPLIDQAIGAAHEFRVEVAGEGLAVSVDQGRLSSGLLNIIFNARDAMESRGTITLRAARTEATAGDGSLHDMIAISVSDTGRGMSPEVAARAFEPFFTTKQVGSGTGLGLATVYSFAQQSGGWAAIDSTEGVGTTVTIYLPPAHSTAEPAAGDTVDDSDWIVRRALVIDDEPALADLVAAWLSDLGISVRTAYTPAEAQRIAAEFSPQLVISDANLRAEMDGLELARVLVELLPSLIVVFMTGFSDRIKALQAAGVATLAKPFTRDDLLKVLSQHAGLRARGHES